MERGKRVTKPMFGTEVRSCLPARNVPCEARQERARNSVGQRETSSSAAIHPVQASARGTAAVLEGRALELQPNQNTLGFWQVSVRRLFPRGYLVFPVEA